MDLKSPNLQEALERISRHCPEALSTYLHCMNRANEQRRVSFSREMIEIDMSENWTKFKNGIKKLALENILEWHLMNNRISITLAALDER